MSTFTELVQARRSAMNFVEGIKIPQAELEEMFSYARLAPSAFNLQHTHYKVVADENLKEEIRKAAYGQYKIHTASAVILVLGDKQAYLQAPEIYSGLKLLGAMSEEEFDKTIESINSSYIDNDAFQRDEAIRNASLSAMQFMLIAKDKGWDTCPMIGFDAEAVSRTLNLPEHMVPVMMITIGKDNQRKIRPRGYRKPVNEFVEFF
ncbi:putative NAD(P)H nitroreductase MhqN [Paenibacillus albidus]|uniref:NAD(P)H nitroreductase MhqN n=1 Tax=Paenibacillus albidus TaxID=2041023 RepID=A0A917C7N9_9BACL|nr:nitroreductase family protein [Paenibacillus albidus]MBT2292639.1 nitroreductase family protein [Paenibacillus albidus]GGF71680.1 putative NAD(P)H nitroreductase MhqN [Paenibacillus albidus]